MRALVLAALLSLPLHRGGAAEPDHCREMRLTGYVRSEYGPVTADGTPIGTAEPIVAASWDIPMGSMVEIEDLGTYRVADRGMLGSDGWIDVAVWSRPEAYRLTGSRRVCVTRPADP